MTLFQHQRRIIEDAPLWTGLFLGTGSSKTRISLELARGKTLVITPKLQREQQTFQREAEKWGIDVDLTAISKEQFKKFYNKNELGQFDTVIIDEAHTCAGLKPNVRYKNRQPYPDASQLFWSLYYYLKEYPPKRLYLLTATPVRSPMSVLALSWLLGYKWNFWKFRAKFYVKIKKGYHDIWIPRNDEASKQLIGKLVRKLGYTGQLSDYFDVPDQTYKTIPVELTTEQKRRIKEIPLEYPDPLVLVGKKHQIENGVLAGDEFTPDEFLKDNKIETLKDLALEFPKMIVWAKYTNQIFKISKELTKEGYNVRVVTGTSKDRDENITKAEQEESCILVVQSQISAGWEAPSFPVMVFASQSYAVTDRIQGEGRILRANALKKNLFITLITKGGVDEAVDKSVRNKVDFNERIFIEGNL